MTPPVIVGIDPGLSGAIAIINAATGALIDAMLAFYYELPGSVVDWVHGDEVAA